MNQPSEEIKRRLDIVDVLREYIPLKAAGINFKANCPFHREKSPSFMVSPEKQIWHCFGCGKGGDIFSFVQEIEGLTFIEVLRMLAPRAGVELKAIDPKQTSRRNRILDVLEWSKKYYHKVLLDTPMAANARKYLEERGLTDETIDDWGIGFSLDSWDDLTNFLKSKGFKDEEIFEAGMSVKKDGANRFYNRFRGRIMFPINDVNGNTVAFTARVSPEKEAEEKMGKYINSPQTPVYDKGQLLFGLDRAKTEIRTKDLAIIVEGQMDVITAHQHGYKNIIASSGTALTLDQIKLVKRYTNNVAFALDSDSAGQIAVGRGNKLISDGRGDVELREDSRGVRKNYLIPGVTDGMNESLIVIDQGKDPDEFIKKDPEGWARAVDNKIPLMQYFFDTIVKQYDDFDNIDNKREIASKVLSKIINLKDKIEEGHWLKKLAEKIDVEENVLRETLSSSKIVNTKKESEKKKVDSIKPTTKNRAEIMSELLLALIFKFTDLIDYVLNHISVDQLSGEFNRSIYKKLILYYNEISNLNNQELNSSLGYQSFRVWLENNLNNDETINNQAIINQLKFFDKLVILADKDYFEFDLAEAKNEVIKITIFIKKNFLINRMKEVEKLIAQAERAKEEEKVNMYMEELNMLTDDLKEIV